MTLQVDQKIYETFPGLHLGVITVTNLQNLDSSEEVSDLIRSEQEKIRANYDLDSYKEDPRFKAWQEAYALFGGKPKKYRCSVENLYRMTLEGIDLRPISKLVDIYNLISLKYGVPVGGDDLDQVDGQITLTFATGEEPFIVLNAQDVEHPKPGEVIYKDNKDVLCRRWNWRESNKTKMTTGTKNALLIVEGLPPVEREDVEQATKELLELIRSYCGGEAEYTILSASSG